MQAIKASRFDATALLGGPPRDVPPETVREKTKPKVVDQARREMRWKNRTLDTLTVLTRLKEEMPEVWEISTVVGQWVWITFPMKPAADIREKLCDLGFIWNQKRGAWQHSCGAFRHYAKGDPRFSYGEVSAVEMDTEPTMESVA